MAKKETKQGNPLLGKNIPAPPADTSSPSPGTESGALPRYSNTVENRETVMTQNSILQQSDIAALGQKGTTPQSGKTKITLYPTSEQADRLYDLMEAYRKRTGVRINQQDVLRRLIEIATIDMLMPS